MARQFFCTDCGQRLVGSFSQQIGGKTYCLACYSKIMEQQIGMEQVQNSIYDYIKHLFHICECPPEVVGAIETLLKQGKTLSGIRATLYYYYEIRGHEPDASSLIFVSKVIKEQYDSARQYFANQKKLREKNMGVDLTPTVNTVILKQSPQSKPKKTNYRMEDL